MGRSETPLDPSAGAVQRFAVELRKLRQEAGGPTYREMAGPAGYSVSVLSRAAAGQQLPSWPVVEAYVRVCGGDVADWRMRWQQVADAQSAPAADGRPGQQVAPYQGLTHYGTEDQHRFFGRHRLLEQVSGLLGRRSFAAVFGPSGSGKSSLLRAGLIPAARGGALGSPVRTVAVLTPGAHPMREHAAALAAFTAGAGAGGGLVVVDQFEEVFTLCSDVAERAAFIDALLQVAEPGGGRVVLAVRADFFGRCAEHPALTVALHGATVLVGPMSREELREAIVKPATTAGLIVERALTARVVDDIAGEPGGLPLMSHALLETWRRRRGTLLTLEGYERAGGAHGAIAATAERLYAQLPPYEADQAKRVLLRLVNPGEQAADTRRPASYDEFNPAACPQGALEQLAAARLVTLHEHHVELAHEALITSWPRLRAWIDQERELLRQRRRLSEAAAVWAEHGRDPGALYQGARLMAARPLLARPDDLTIAEHAFLQASVQAAEQAERAAVRRRRLTRLAVAALTVLAVVASSTAVAAITAARQADARGREVLARLLAKSSDDVAATDPALSGLLAATSWHFAPTAEARYGMLTTLTSSVNSVLHSPTGAVTTVTFSPDGSLLATVNADGIVQLWQVAAHRLIAALPAKSPGAGGNVTVAFSPDGSLLATAGGGADVRLWDVATHRPTATLTTGRTFVTHLAFSPDGARLNTAADDGTVQVWDVTTRRPLATAPTPHPEEIPGGHTSVTFSPDGATFTTNRDGEARVQRWDLATRRVIGPLFDGDAGPSPDVRFSSDGATAATFGDSNTVRLWDVATRTSIGEPLLTGYTSDLAFSPDGSLLATVTQNDKRIRLWNARTQARLATPLSGHTGTVTDIAFSPDGRTLASASDDGTIRLWNTTARHATSVPLTGHALDVNAVAFSPDGRLLATGSTDKTIRLWDTVTRRLAGAPLSNPTGAIAAVVFSPDGRLLATAGSDESVRLWDAATCRPVGTLHGNGWGAINAVAFSLDGKKLAAGTWGSVTQIWDVATRRPIGAPLRYYAGSINAVAFSPDGRKLATGNWYGATQLWDVTTHRQIDGPLA